MVSNRMDEFILGGKTKACMHSAPQGGLCTYWGPTRLYTHQGRSLGQSEQLLRGITREQPPHPATLLATFLATTPASNGQMQRSNGCVGGAMPTPGGLHGFQPTTDV